MKYTSIHPASHISANERAVCEACGISPEDFAACSSEEAKPNETPLTESELAMCRATGVTPEEFQAAKLAAPPIRLRD